MEYIRLYLNAWLGFWYCTFLQIFCIHLHSSLHWNRQNCQNRPIPTILNLRSTFARFIDKGFILWQNMAMSKRLHWNNLPTNCETLPLNCPRNLWMPPQLRWSTFILTMSTWATGIIAAASSCKPNLTTVNQAYTKQNQTTYDFAS